MRCPSCGNVDDKVIESRTLANGGAVRRRRECGACGYRFTSYERIEEKSLMVIKRDGRREPFDRDKLEAGLERAVQKRPVSRLDIERLVNEIEDQTAISAGLSREASTDLIGEMALEKLGELDKVAYIRFASVCRRFENLDEFIREINKLGETGKKNDTKCCEAVG
ncbi:MAG: transcriptional regulator NrdR [Spirochaetaceae bacterium]|jgi:transcriptional repressor NrdR|nr:transcriptional regulator NrdR [Spirochaetaceae bacterium]